MSKKYEHRIETLKEHKQDKEHKHHHSKKKSNNSKRKANDEKNAFKNFQKKLDKSKKIW